MFYTSFLKPVTDRFVACILLILFCPLYLLLMMVLKIYMGQIFFVQERPGKNERTFRLIKFRTMTGSENKLGSWLRKTSLDELPQLVNVLKGEMSLIGPRPLLMEYLPFYSDEERKRHETKPGITGWAQVRGRNQLGWGQRMEDDIYYVVHQSLLLDLRIMVLTFLEVFKFRKADFHEQEMETFETYAQRR